MANSKRTNTAKWQASRSRWRISVQKDGIRKSFYSVTPGRAGQREVNAKADRWLAGTKDEFERLTTAEAWDCYIEDKKNYLSRATWAVELSHYKNWISKLNKKKVAELVPYDFQKILTAAYKKGLSKKTLQNIRATCTQFLKYCRLQHWTDLRIDDITIPHAARGVQKHILQPEHLRTLFTSSDIVMRGEVVPDPFIQAYRFQVLTGLRPGELMALRWKDINDLTVHVSGSIDRYGERTPGKNENAIRDFYLNDLTRQILTEQKEKKLHTQYVFDIHSMQTYRKHFERYCEYNGIPHTTPYELRHTFVSFAKNLSEGQLKQIVGHSKSMDTYGIYSHTVDGDLKSAADQLNSVFKSFLFPEDEAK